MKNNTLTLLLLSNLFLIGSATTAMAQEETTEEETPAITISGSIDTYARTSFSTTNPFMGTYAPSSSFANLKGFSLGMANLIVSHSGEKSGFVADLVFGPRGRDAVFYDIPNAYTGQRIINQMYGYVKLGEKVTLNLGQFNTFLGYEVISPTINVNYSTSYLFSYGPFTHTGLRADFDLGNGLGAKLAVMNPTDVLEFNTINTFTLGAQLSKTTDAGGIWLNFIYGDQDGKLDTDVDPAGSTSGGALFQADLTAGWNLSEKFYLGINASYQTVADGDSIVGTEIQDLGADPTSFFGVAVYPKLAVSEAFTLAFRGEYFSVAKSHLGIFGLDTSGNGSVMEFTLSGNYTIGNMTLIPEFRIDKTSEDSFLKKDGTATDLMPSLLLAAVYKF